MGMNKPAGYSNTDTAENMAKAIFEILIDQKHVKSDIRTRDKFPNTDGTLELVDDNQIPYGKIDIQLKAIPKNTRKFNCPTSSVEYSRRTTIPFILICVDITCKKAYWRQINDDMPEYKKDQKSFTVKFDKQIDEIDGNHAYIGKWAELVFDYQERVSNYPSLKHDVSTRLNLDGIPPEDIKFFQQMIDRINDLLDNDLSVVKKIFFPDTWKLGIGISTNRNNHLSYIIYKVKHGEAHPLICMRKIETKDRATGDTRSSNLANTNSISEHFSSKAVNDNPESIGENFVAEKFNRLIESRSLPVHGQNLAIDIAFEFIDSYHHLLELPPRQDSYSVSEIVRGFDRLMQSCRLIASQSWTAKQIEPNSFLVINLDTMSSTSMNRYESTSESFDVVVPYRVHSHKASVSAFNQAIRILSANDYAKLNRRWTFPSISNIDKTNQQKIDQELYRESLLAQEIFNSILDDYSELISGNRIGFANSLFLSPRHSIMYSYSQCSETDSRPRLFTWILDDPTHRIPKCQLLSPEDSELLFSKHYTGKLTIDNHCFDVIYHTISMTNILRTRSPYLNMLYDMLAIDFNRNFCKTDPISGLPRYS